MGDLPAWMPTAVELFISSFQTICPLLVFSQARFFLLGRPLPCPVASPSLSISHADNLLLRQGWEIGSVVFRESGPHCRESLQKQPVSKVARFSGSSSVEGPDAKLLRISVAMRMWSYGQNSLYTA